MIVFHSSPCIVNHPDVSFSRDYLDFGKGFYVTTIEEQARKYARRFLLRGMNAYLNKYELSDDLRNYNARYSIRMTIHGWILWRYAEPEEISQTTILLRVESQTIKCSER